MPFWQFIINAKRQAPGPQTEMEGTRLLGFGGPQNEKVRIFVFTVKREKMNVTIWVVGGLFTGARFQKS